MVEELYNLFFELSNEDRLNILYELREEPLRMSYLSSKLDFTVQETSRNLSRLSDLGLIRKDNSGLYYLTPYGEGAFQLIPSFKFLSCNKEYFMSHKLTSIPYEFTISIGSLADCDYVNDVMTAFFKIENMIKEAKEYIWILVDQILASSLPLLSDAIKRGVFFRLILPLDISPSDELHGLLQEHFYDATEDLVDGRFLESIEIVLCISEKEVAALSFPDLRGKFDYTGFNTKDEKALKWSKNLFNYYWEETTKIIPEQLLD
jgi:predicted transcriptional regulator